MHDNPDSPLAIGPEPTFKSRWGDPNHPGSNGNLRSIITGTVSDRRSRRKDRRDSIDSDKRQRRRDKNGSKKEDRLGLIKGVRGMVSGTGRQNQSLIKGMKGIGMNKVRI
jgi:hypothetical protein